MSTASKRSTPEAKRGGKRRPFRRRHSSNKARVNDVYAMDEIIRLYGVDEQTVRNWFKAGLERVAGIAKILVRGEALNAFHAARNAKARQTLTATQFLCFACRKPREPAPGTVKGTDEKATTKRLEARCCVCNSAMYRAWSCEAAEALRVDAARLAPRSIPTVNPPTVPPQATPQMRQHASTCDSLTQDETGSPQIHDRTNDGPADAIESRQFALPFGF